MKKDNFFILQRIIHLYENKLTGRKFHFRGKDYNLSIKIGKIDIVFAYDWMIPTHRLIFLIPEIYGYNKNNKIKNSYLPEISYFYGSSENVNGITEIPFYRLLTHSFDLDKDEITCIYDEEQYLNYLKEFTTQRSHL